MNGLFSGLTNLNVDISKWDTSSVTDMSSMFYVIQTPHLIHMQAKDPLVK